MTPDLKKELSKHLKDAILAEHLWNAEAGRMLNLIPNYVSMFLKEKYWSKAPLSAWAQLNEWHTSGLKLSEFQVLHAEEAPINRKCYSRITKKEKPGKDLEPAEKDEFSPENLENGEIKKTENLVQKTLENNSEDLEKTQASHLFRNNMQMDAISGSNNQVHQKKEEQSLIRLGLEIEISFLINGQKICVR